MKTIVEKLSPSHSHCFAGKLLYQHRTRHQMIQVLGTEWFGNMLFLDGIPQVSDRYGFIYNELIVHPAMLTHKRPERVLVLGGGVGGSTVEVLKHPTVSEVCMVEIDDELPEVAKRFFPGSYGKVSSDSRVSIHIEDGYDFLIEELQSRRHFDVIILDLTDSFNPISRRLFRRSFYYKILKRIIKGGIASSQAESTHYSYGFRIHPFQSVLNQLAGCFRNLRPLHAWIPFYASDWGFVAMSDKYDPQRLDAARIDRIISKRRLKLTYYCPHIHEAIFTFPMNLHLMVNRSLTKRRWLLNGR